MGSAPGESTKIRGDAQWLSMNAFGKSKGGGSMNFCPKLLVMKLCIAGTIYEKKLLKISNKVNLCN